MNKSGIYKKLQTKIKLKINKIFENKHLLNRVNYDQIYNKIIRRNLNDFKKKIYLGAFVDYDDTPRRKYLGFVVDNVTPNKFENYLNILLKKSQEIESEFLFLTAWNEWAEGAYIEPDERNEYGFLEAIMNARKKL